MDEKKLKGHLDEFGVDLEDDCPRQNDSTSPGLNLRQFSKHEIWIADHKVAKQISLIFLTAFLSSWWSCLGQSHLNRWKQVCHEILSLMVGR